MFQIWCKSMVDGEWTLYGEFKSEAEFRKEIPNIRACGLYTKRVRVAPQE